MSKRKIDSISTSQEDKNVDDVERAKRPRTDDNEPKSVSWHAKWEIGTSDETTMISTWCQTDNKATMIQSVFRDAKDQPFEHTFTTTGQLHAEQMHAYFMWHHLVQLHRNLAKCLDMIKFPLPPDPRKEKVEYEHKGWKCIAKPDGSTTSIKTWQTNASANSTTLTTTYEYVDGVPWLKQACQWPASAATNADAVRMHIYFHHRLTHEMIVWSKAAFMVIGAKLELPLSCSYDVNLQTTSKAVQTRPAPESPSWYTKCLIM